jgi:cytochrome c2
MPASLRWLLALVLLAVGAAAASGAALYLETRHATRITAEAIAGGDVGAGRAAIGRVGCGGCHVIPGVAGANGRVGPPLGGVATRAEIAGILANDPEHLRRWIARPQAVLPGNAMPDQPVSDLEARDIVAYLYTLKR